MRRAKFKTCVFWNLTPCGLVYRYQRIGARFSHHLSLFWDDKKQNKFLRKVGVSLTSFKASQRQRTYMSWDVVTPKWSLTDGRCYVKPHCIELRPFFALPHPSLSKPRFITWIKGRVVCWGFGVVCLFNDAVSVTEILRLRMSRNGFYTWSSWSFCSKRQDEGKLNQCGKVLRRWYLNRVQQAKLKSTGKVHTEQSMKAHRGSRSRALLFL